MDFPPEFEPEAHRGDPFALLARWLAEAEATGLRNHNAMVLSTATPEGDPSARVVLLKGLEPNGLVFFTNYESDKAALLAANPRAAVTFYWEVLERQVRVRGAVERVSAAESDAYFLSRPLGSRHGAWASPQSRVIESRAFLEAEVEQVRARFGSEVPRPPHWGGFRVQPNVFEFWAGRRDRLHDRFRFTGRPESGWSIERLAP